MAASRFLHSSLASGSFLAAVGFLTGLPNLPMPLSSDFTGSLAFFVQSRCLILPITSAYCNSRVAISELSNFYNCDRATCSCGSAMGLGGWASTSGKWNRLWVLAVFGLRSFLCIVQITLWNQLQHQYIITDIVPLSLLDYTLRSGHPWLFQTAYHIKLIIKQMGNCAGCANPQRRYRPNRGQLPTAPPMAASPSPIKQYDSGPGAVYRSQQHSIFYSESKPRITTSSPLEDPWKSRVNSRVIRKYVKQPTLREEESKRDHTVEDNYMFIVDQHAQSIRAESLEESIAARNLMSLHEAKEKYGHQYQQRFCEEPEEIKEILYENGSSSRNYGSNLPTPLSLPYRIKSVPPLDQAEAEDYYSQSARAAKYLPRKVEKMRERHLQEILEEFQKEAETPGYVRAMRREQGEDIRMDNFEKFEPLPDFPAFCISKYLRQLEEQPKKEEPNKLQASTDSKSTDKKLADHQQFGLFSSSKAPLDSDQNTYLKSEPRALTNRYKNSQIRIETNESLSDDLVLIPAK